MHRGHGLGVAADLKVLPAASRSLPHVELNRSSGPRGPTDHDAPDDLDLGHQTQEWLATSAGPEAMTAGGYWYHGERRNLHRSVHDEAFQDALLKTFDGRDGYGAKKGIGQLPGPPASTCRNAAAAATRGVALGASAATRAPPRAGVILGEGCGLLGRESHVSRKR